MEETRARQSTRYGMVGTVSKLVNWYELRNKKVFVMRDLRSGPPTAGSGPGEVIIRAPTSKGRSARGKVRKQSREDLQT